MNKSNHLTLPPQILKGITSVFRLKPLDELDGFLQLIQKRKFDEALEQLQPDANECMERFINKYMSSNPPREEPFLHLILASRPPFSLFSIVWTTLNTIMGQDFTPDESLNARKQTPLHVACYSQCGADVIRELLNGRSGMVPSICRDEDFRCPLHLLFVSDHLGPLAQVMEIVNMLLDCECFVAHMADDYDRTPLDYARAKRVNDRITDMLLEARMHLNDDDHDARSPFTDPSQECEVVVAAGPIPVAIEYDPATADDISTIDMKETKLKTDLNYEWEITNEAEDEHVEASAPVEDAETTPDEARWI
ncbi:hypothetical protein MPSEU_000224200 [Mayamaea pseudoterrestris]|nr:hypothetical protein MPSEU_000224200 [Mayamaea pseudoterrestris]